MKVKNALLLASMALLAIALTAPVSAQAADYWWWDGEGNFYPTLGDEKTVEPKGHLSITVNGVQFGPCEEEIRLDGWIWNEEEGMGEGEVTEVLDVGKNCNTGIPGCKIDEVRGGNFPWPVTLKLEKKVEISAIEIEVDFAEGCIGVPPVMTVSGTVEGQFFDFVPPTKEEEEKEELGKAATVDFNESPGLLAEGFPALLDGFLRFGTKVEAHLME